MQKWCRWLGQKSNSTVQLEACKQDPRPLFHDYLVTVVTSDIRNAGTDGDVTVDIQGVHIST